MSLNVIEKSHPSNRIEKRKKINVTLEYYQISYCKDLIAIKDV